MWHEKQQNHDIVKHIVTKEAFYYHAILCSNTDMNISKE